MKKLLALHIILLTFFLSSCFKEDQKITPHDPGNVTTDTIEMMHDYRYQVYFSLHTNEVVSTNLKKTWDLGFDCSADGWRVILNTSNFMLAAGTSETDLSVSLDTVGLSWKYDASTGTLDSTAFGQWVTFHEPDSAKSYSHEVYAINRGYDEAGNLRGMRKVVFEEVTDSSYVISYAMLDGSDEHTFTVIKDPSVNYICFSFDDGGEVLDLEPPKYDWDLLFTQYTTLLFTNEGDPYPYLVTGVLANPATVEIAQDTLYDFSAIDLNVAQGLAYSKEQDVIGYDWKDVVGDVSSGNVSYVIVPGLNYVIHDYEGFYYKVRFIGFYSNTGEKGYPVFEYQQL